MNHKARNTNDGQETGMRRIAIAITTLAALAGLAIGAAPAYAQSGHFIESGAGAPTCTDIGLQVECTGKVAGLGGTTFEITVQAEGIATVVCINPAGNRAPGQDTAVTVSGTTTPLPTPRNGQFVFTVTTDSPAPLPATPTCPNEQWTPVITDVAFTTATLTLLEDGVVSDVITVTVT
ncbi:MAG TPA: hypothetical protein VK360_01585 [Acidimicrobiales bacterium]|nr:hypothetical protein [Acidimicrobiales bacterium]